MKTQSGPDLKRLRLELGLNQGSVANAIGVTIQTISEVERLAEDSDLYEDRRSAIAEFLEEVRVARGVSIPVEGVAAPGTGVQSLVVDAICAGEAPPYSELELGLQDWYTIADPQARPEWFGVRVDAAVRFVESGDIVFFAPGDKADHNDVVLAARKAGKGWQLGLGVVQRLEAVNVLALALVVPSLQMGMLSEWRVIARAVGLHRFWG